MARVTKPGGRVGVTVWSHPEQSPFLDLETAMLARHGSGAQAAFSVADEQLRWWFRDAGLNDIKVERIRAEVDLPPVTDFVPQHLQALPWSAGFFALTADEQAAAINELRANLAEYETDAGITVPFSSTLATATT